MSAGRIGTSGRFSAGNELVIKAIHSNNKENAMKNKNFIFSAKAVLATSIMITGIAGAEELPQTRAHEQFSVTQGFREPVVAELHRVSAADQSKVSSALIEKLRPGSAYQSAKQGSKLHITGKEWSLDVTADGSGAEYQDHAVGARAHSLGKPLPEKMSAAELEQKGRAFVAANLASQIVLGLNEELISLRADYRTEGGHDLTTGEITHAVVASRIVFGRTLHGVPIVGNGSKVIITFTNDGSLESFRDDWPKYQTAASQKVVDAGEILSRVQKVIGVRSGVTAPTSGVTVPSSEDEAYPVALTPNTQLQSLDCGYYDASSFAEHTTQSIQPGCTYLTVSQDSTGMRAGYAGAVPAGAQFEQESTWLETQILSKK
jgi:hypothetical protein